MIIPLYCKKTDIDEDAFLKKENRLNNKEIRKAKGFGVVTVNSLRFRTDNDLHSKILRHLDKGVIVTVLNKDYNRVKIGEMEDYWCQIEYNGITGWVFGYFLDIYSSYENAQIGLKKQLQPITSDKEKTKMYYEDAINKNLFFLSNGKILQVIDGRKSITKILRTEPDLIVTNYFFTNHSSYLYYIAKYSNNLIGNGSLYLYNLNTERNKLIVKEVYTADINNEKKIVLILSLQKSTQSEYWIISLLNIESKSNIKEITRIKKNKKIESIENDPFSMTLSRELGSLVYLKLDEIGNFIYFRPPEEDQTYLISISNGEYIQVESKRSDVFNIDSSQFISISSDQDVNGKGIYSIVLKDKFSGMEKEIIRSNLYPINFSISSKKNFLGISMVDLNKLEKKYYLSSIYVLSLSTYSLITISTKGESYQPRWSNSLLR